MAEVEVGSWKKKGHVKNLKGSQMVISMTSTLWTSHLIIGVNGKLSVKVLILHFKP
jgi:hypothetical protein